MVSIEEKSTRGKTQPRRLRFVDRWLRARMNRGFAPDRVVDLGPGEHAWTTLELAKTLRDDARLYAVENDARRCEQLRSQADGTFEVRLGGFDLAGLDDVDLVRAMNLFRQYHPDEVADGYRQLASRLSADGRLVAGSCDKTGEVGSFWVMGPDAERLALVVWSTGARGFAPIQLRDYLPQDIRRDASERNPFWKIEAAWTSAWEESRGDLAPADAFDASIVELGGQAKLLAPGLAEFVWR